jgi:thiosulfate/3-mercaptopyruvate sulfurtransferase
MKAAAVLLALCGALCVTVTAATRTEMLVSAEWLAEHLNDPGLVVLQVGGNRNGYDAGHIPGARFLAQSSITVTRDGVPNELPPVADLKKAFEAVGVSDNARVILYTEGSVLPATRAYFTLDYLGLGDRAALLDGGLEKWKAEGRALSQQTPAAAQGSFTPRTKVDLVAQIEAVNQIAASKSAVLLDVRSAADFSGERGSHIPGAANVFWNENLMSRENPSLRAEADLRRLYEAAGITPDRSVVTYCNSGMQSSQSYFTLKYLGYDVKMYDGSLSEWTAKGSPVEK